MENNKELMAVNEDLLTTITINDFIKFDDVSGLLFSNYEDIDGITTKAFFNTFGNDLDLSPETTVGTFKNMLNMLFYASCSATVHTFNQNNINYATGYFLNMLGEAKGIRRHNGRKATAEVVIIGKPGLYLTRGLKLRAKDGTIFITLENVVLDNNGKAQNVVCSSENIGDIKVPPFAINSFVDFVDGLSEVYNLKPGTSGAEIESDVSYRERIKKSAYLNSNTTPKSVNTYILNSSPETIDSVVVNNLTDSPIKVNDNLSIPVGAYWVCVWGGDPENIARAIFMKAGGAISVGEERISIKDANNKTYFIRFNFAKPKLYDILLTISSGGGHEIKRVKEAIDKLNSGDLNNKYLLKIGQNVTPINVSQFLTKAVPELNLKNLQIGSFNLNLLEETILNALVFILAKIKELEAKIDLTAEDKQELFKQIALLVLCKYALYMINNLKSHTDNITLKNIEKIQKNILADLFEVFSTEYVTTLFTKLENKLQEKTSLTYNEAITFIKDNVTYDISENPLYKSVLNLEQSFTKMDILNINMDEIGVPNKVKVVINE